MSVVKLTVTTSHAKSDYSIGNLPWAYMLVVL